MNALFKYFHEVITKKEDVDKLKQLILQAAVQGKLVKQDPHDESANELLKKSDQEKQGVIAKKKSRKFKYFPLAQEEMPYQLPQGWKWVRLGEILTYQQGLQVGKAEQIVDYKEGYIRYLRIIDFRNDADIRYIKDVKNRDVYCTENDLIMIRYGGTAGEIVSGKKGIFHNNMFRIDFNKDILHPKYLYYFLIREETRNALFGSSTSSTMPQISHKTMNNIIFPMPPIKEQYRIVKRVEELLEQCNELSAKFIKRQMKLKLLNDSVFTRIQDCTNPSQMENLRFALNNMEHLCSDRESISQIRDSLLSLAIQGKLLKQNPNDEPVSVLLEKIKEEKDRLVKVKKLKKEKLLPSITLEEIPFKLPKGWEWERIGNISKIIEYGTSQKASEQKLGIPVLRMNNILNGKIVLNSLKYVQEGIKDLPRLYLNTGDLLFNRTNSYELVGKTAVFNERIPFTFASYLIRISLFNEYVDPNYVNFMMNSRIYRLTQIEPGIVQQNGQANFNGTKLKNTLIPIPPLNEQKRIVKKVNQLMALCDELEKNIEQSKLKSEKLMKAVLQEALNVKEEVLN